MVSTVEIETAVMAVRRASALCRAAQGRLAAGDTLAKSDDSPVTVADFATQAVVCATLSASLGAVDVVGEEDAADLADPVQAELLAGVTALVSGALDEPVTQGQVLEWIALGGADGSSGRYWTLDPIDGTKGFLRGDQYAIALALIDGGEVVAGVLGCPNLPNANGSIGAIFVADGARAAVYGADTEVAAPIAVARPASLAEARVCESVEAAHSSHDDSRAITELLGIATEPYRIDSQCKYAVVARGDASIYLRLPTSADYREKVWDHAAGLFVVECAGGRVTDVTGAPLDFGHGRLLEHNKGVVATDGSAHDDVIAAVRQVLGIDSN